MYVVFVFCCISLGCVSAQPTINQCTSDETIRQVALMEQTLAALQSMDRRLQSMERRLEESNNGELRNVIIELARIRARAYAYALV